MTHYIVDNNGWLLSTQYTSPKDASAAITEAPPVPANGLWPRRSAGKWVLESRPPAQLVSADGRIVPNDGTAQDGVPLDSVEGRRRIAIVGGVRRAKVAREMSQYEPILVGGRTWDADKPSQERMAQALLVSLWKPADWRVEWSTSTGDTVMLSAVELRQIYSAIFDRQQEAYRQYRSAKSAIVSNN
jgi:hypothetical protein